MSKKENPLDEKEQLIADIEAIGIPIKNENYFKPSKTEINLFRALINKIGSQVAPTLKPTDTTSDKIGAPALVKVGPVNDAV